MAAFDLNNLYFLKNNAPKTTSFEDLSSQMESGFNLGVSAKQAYDENSLDDLIRRREAEGIPFDRLSNEMAKYGKQGREAAINARNERRTSLDKNFQWQKDQFDTWRKNMARRICGLILQKADELRIPEEERYRVLNIAANFVVTYDPDLANQLRSEATRRSYNQARTAPKETNQDESKLYPSEIASRKAKANDVDFAGSNRFLGVYQNNSANVGSMLTSLFTVGKLGYLKKAWMDGVTMYAMSTDPKKFDSNDIWDENTISDAIDLFMNSGLQNVDFNPTFEEPKSNDVPSEGKKPISKKVVRPEVVPDGKDYASSIISYYIPGDARKGRRENLDVSKLEKDLKKYYNDVDALSYIVSVLGKDNQKFAGVKADASGNSEVAVVKTNREKVQKRIEELKELEKGGISPKSAKILKLEGRNIKDEKAEWDRISNLPKIYYTNPGAILPAMQRSLLPQERTTDADVMRTVLSGSGVDNDIASAIADAYASSNNNTLANLMKKDAYKSAARALAPFIVERLQNRYDALVKRAGGNKEDVDKALQEAYDMSDEVIAFLRGDKVLYTDKEKYEAKAKEIMSEVKAKEDAQWAKEHSGVDKSMMDLDLGGI